jgi:hypothetical protein
MGVRRTPEARPAVIGAARAEVAGRPPWPGVPCSPRLPVVAAAAPIWGFLAVVSASAGIVLALLLGAVVVVTAAVLWVVFRLMADHADDEHPAGSGSR